jgi:hypothetical protein
VAFPFLTCGKYVHTDKKENKMKEIRATAIEADIQILLQLVVR